MSKKKLRVAVVYGGRSSEHEVSCRSAAAILRNLDKSKYDIVPMGITKEGEWLANDYSTLLELDPKSMHVKTKNSQLTTFDGDPTQSHNFDVIIPVLHGVLGEDGTIQGLFEMADLPYVGCGVLASAIGMDKDVAKRLVRDAGIPIPPYITVRSHELQNAKKILTNVEQELGFPVFVKPANAGSSVGITKVHTPQKLQSALELAMQHDTKALIEKSINARDIEFAVLENLDPRQPPLVSSVAGELIPVVDEFYSYDAKYAAQGANEEIPARITAEQLQTLRNYAQKIFQVLECNGLTRVDFFIDKDTDAVYFNEVNTMPGFTQISLYPKLWEASGMSFQDLLTYLVELAIKRYEAKHRLEYYSVKINYER
jgi:D-alanine-D-alanine ligase